jgi:hypothetical protein
MLTPFNESQLLKLLSNSTTLVATQAARPNIKEFADKSNQVLGTNPQIMNLMLYASALSLNDIRYYWPASVLKQVDTLHREAGVYLYALNMMVVSDQECTKRERGQWLSLLSVPDDHAARLYRRVLGMP